MCIGGWDWAGCSIFGSHVSITGMVNFFFFFFKAKELEGGVWGGRFFFFLGGERSLEIFQTVPFCFQKNPSTCVNVLFVPWPIV